MSDWYRSNVIRSEATATLDLRTLSDEDLGRFLAGVGPVIEYGGWAARHGRAQRPGAYDTVFVYHNGAESYYAARGFRCSLRV